VRDQLDAKQALHGLMPNGDECRRCHREHNGAHAALTKMGSFNHDWTAFTLTGKHESAACKACHTSQAYKGTSQACSSCHADTHHKGSMGANCRQCHGTSEWKGAVFDHDRTSFKLTGKHVTAECAACHKGAVYKETPDACVSCHADTKHKGSFGTNCQQCHNTSNWKAAEFVHRFPIQHGSRRRSNNTCATCHADESNYKAYTCYNCHEHTPAKMERIHTRRKIMNFNACADCHFRKKRDRRETRLDETDTLQQWLEASMARAGCPAGDTPHQSSSSSEE
jgi:hypothetical protein